MGSTRHEAPSYATASQDGAVVVVRRDGARATVVELDDGLVRVRVLHHTAAGWVALSDMTLDTLDVCTPLDPHDAPLALLAEAA